MHSETHDYGIPTGDDRQEGGPSMPVFDKYTGEVIGNVPVAARETVDRALSAASEAFASFSHTATHVRSGILGRAAGLLDKYGEELATLLVREAGKPRKYASAEVRRAVETFKFSAEEAGRIHGETIPMDASASGEGRTGFYVRTPVGIVAAITPFNYPLNLVAHKVGPALASGNVVVLKPASATPLVAFRLARILEEAGLPPGVLNVLAGPGGSIGDLLVTDRRVAKISFTGSVPVGERIMSRAGLKKVTMELGSNSGTIVEPDADQDDAVRRCAAGAFANNGQDCASVQRLFVHEAVAAEFKKRLVDIVSQMKVGNPLDEDCDVGPMIHEAEAVRAESWVREAVEQGAKVLIGGRREGAVLYPTVLADVRPEMKVMRMEVFAPVVSILAHGRFEDAVRLVDDSPYGLQAGVFTRDIRKALYAVNRINVGGVMINDTSAFRVDHMPYGGNKMTGMGREGVRFAVEEMTNLRLVVIRSSGPLEGHADAVSRRAGE